MKKVDGRWVDSIGGLSALLKKSRANLAVIEEFVGKHEWISFLAKDPATISNTSVCLQLTLDAEKVKPVNIFFWRRWIDGCLLKRTLPLTA